MPATENVWRNLRTMHVVFAASSIALFAATLYMMKADYTDEWRDIQRTGLLLKAKQLEDEAARFNTPEFKAFEADLQEKLTAAEADIAGHKEELAKAEAAVARIDGEFQMLNRTVKTDRAERDKARADLDLNIRDGLVGKALKPAQENFDKAQKLVDQLEFQLQDLQARLDAARAEVAKITKARDEVQAARKKHRLELDRLLATREKIAPQTDAAARFKHWLMELPIIEGFNGHLKLDQIWLPELKINYGGMGDVARFDRCTTCHINIDSVGTGNVAAFPHDMHGIATTTLTAHEYLNKEVPEGKSSRQREDGTIMGYGHPFSTHPNPDLYLTSSSPHPRQKFGCTGCHEGQGSGTSFQNASHTPNSPDIAESWKQKYSYFNNHFWEFPMYPKRLGEAACLKCHHNVIELGIHPKFGNSAPTLFKGYNLIRQYGCFGCHEINGYSAGKAIGPDMRLEPQTKEEADRIAADPTAVAGTMRKVGPGLRHLASKTSRGWAEQWVAEPKKFRPETRMPQFFGLTNQNDPHAQKLQPVEIAGIVEFLMAKSEKLETEKWDSSYEPDAERGKSLFSQRGCLSCHSHADFPEIKADFGPNLSNVHSKLTSAEWLYTWIRNPTRHSARTRMPNLYLEPETVSGVTIDPAADVVAYLLAKPKGDYPTTKLPGVYLGVTTAKTFALEAARRLGLSEPRGALIASVMPGSAATRTYPVTAEAAKDQTGEANPKRNRKLNGLRVNDVVLKYNGVDVRDGQHLTELVETRTDAGPTSIVIARDNQQLELKVQPATPLFDLARLYLSKTVPAAEAEEILAKREFPEKEIERIAGVTIKPDEIELTVGQLTDEVLLRYVGRRSISRYGCYGCHDIPGYEKARPIGTALQDWGRKDSSKLALEHIEEFLHHHGESDGSSTHDRMAAGLKNGINGNFSSDEERDRETSATYFYDQLIHHGRAGFLWQKLRDPRSYDFRKTETKGYDERLRMPKFPLAEKDIEAIATFVLGLVAEPPAEKYQYRPQGAALARIEGEKLITKYNCTGCHMLELPEVYGIPNDMTGDELAPEQHPESLELLLKLKPPRDAWTNRQLKSGEKVLSFHGLQLQGPDPEDPPEEQSSIYVLWETLKVAEDELFLPTRKVEVPVARQLDVTPPRGGAFAEWLVKELQKLDRNINFDKAWERSPPLLYREGTKVQTPWLYSFLKNPGRIRYTPVLRMPQFNLSDDEAEKLVNYFAAVDGAPFPYTDIPQREPKYLGEQERNHPGYLQDAWKLITYPPPTGICAGCHAVGGREFVAGDPKTVTHGPNLDGVYNRLRPDWVQLWLYNPPWITPFTAMPQNFPRVQPGKAAKLPELFAGDGQKQTVAARDALMNYLRILEREGKATAQGPTAPAAASTEGGK